MSSDEKTVDPAMAFEARANEVMAALSNNEETVAETPAETPAIESKPATEGEKPAGQDPTANTAASEPDDVPSWVTRAVERITEREQRVAQKEKEIPDLIKEARTDLPKFMKERLGVDPDKAARALMAQVLGENAPDAYRQIKEQFDNSTANQNEFETVNSKIQELEARLAAKDAELQQREVVAEAQREVSTYVTGDLKELPTLAKAAKNNAEMVKTHIFNEMVKMANERMKAGIEKVPTAAEAAKRVEAEMSKMAALFANQKNDPTPPPVKAKLTAGQTQQSGIRPEPIDFDERAKAAMAELLG